MYKVYLDNELLYYPGDKGYSVINPVLNLALNDSGTFEFDIPVTHHLYDKIYNRKSMVTVFKDNVEIFRGEVRESDRDIEKTKQVYCVGELAFLFDSIQPQAKYQNYTVRQFLESLINEHNSQVEERKRFEIGIVTATDNNDSVYHFTNRETTLDAIRKKLCDSLNGYLKIRKENGKRYLDLLKLDDYGKKCNQTIEFGVNLLDYAENFSASDIATAVIPLGAKLDESPIKGLDAYTDITSVNEGKDYLYIPEAVERFGWVRVVQKFDNVTKPSFLKTKGEEWLKSTQFESVVLDVKAVDLSIIDKELDSIELGDKVHALATPLGMDTWFPVQKLKIPLQKPQNQTIQLGNTSKKSYTDQASDAEKNTNIELEELKQSQNGMQSAIDNATQMILGSKGGYKISEFDENGLWVRDLYMDAPNKDDAVNILQITNIGIGFSRNGYDGPYETAWTIDGRFVADFIDTGKIAGKVNDKVCFDLDNGLIYGSSLVDTESNIKAEFGTRSFEDQEFRGLTLFDKDSNSDEIVPVAGISRINTSARLDNPTTTFFGNGIVYLQSHGNSMRNNVIGLTTSTNNAGLIYIKKAVLAGEDCYDSVDQETIFEAYKNRLMIKKYVSSDILTYPYLSFSSDATTLGFKKILGTGTSGASTVNFINIFPNDENGLGGKINFCINSKIKAGVNEDGFFISGFSNVGDTLRDLCTRMNNEEAYTKEQFKQIAAVTNDLNTRLIALETKGD